MECVGHFDSSWEYWKKKLLSHKAPSIYTGSVEALGTVKRIRNASKSAIIKAKTEYLEGVCHDVARNPPRSS